jgi:4,5-dihydroxyphthalate decarboxylase
METITFACYDYDRTEPILDGRVLVEGCEVAPVRMKSTVAFPRAIQQAEFDVTELSVSSYLMQTASGTSEYIALPAFVSRTFRHHGIYIRTDRGINSPKDLEGKKVGVPEYQVTMALWARGILKDEYDVDFTKVKYRNGGINTPGRKERLPLILPDYMDVKPIPIDKSLSNMLESGELDAVYSPEEPECFLAGDPKVKRLFDDHVAEEQAYHRKTGFYPIMHFIGVRKALVERCPWIPANLFRALVEAKKVAMDELQEIANYSAIKLTLPWFVSDLENTKNIMGQNYWTYGVEENRNELETMARYSHEQFLANRLLNVDELFAKGTHKIRDI